MTKSKYTLGVIPNQSAFCSNSYVVCKNKKLKLKLHIENEMFLSDKIFMVIRKTKYGFCKMHSQIKSH